MAFDADRMAACSCFSTIADELPLRLQTGNSRAGTDLAQGNGFFGMFGDWAQDIPRDVLNVVGRDQRDQPYFLIWGRDGEVLPSSSTTDVAEWPMSDAEHASMGTPLRQARKTLGVEGNGMIREVMILRPSKAGWWWGRSVAHEREELPNRPGFSWGWAKGSLAVGLAGGWLLPSIPLRFVRSTRSPKQRDRSPPAICPGASTCTAPKPS